MEEVDLVSTAFEAASHTSKLTDLSVDSPWSDQSWIKRLDLIEEQRGSIFDFLSSKRKLSLPCWSP
jgi:hypothetical protein